MNELPRIPKVERLSSFVTRVIGQNPSAFTLQGTNTYLVGDPNQQDRILIDTGSGFEEYTAILKNYLKKKRLNLTAVAITHWHPDHYGGLDEVRKIAPHARLYKYVINTTTVNTGNLEFRHWADEEVIEEAGVHLKAYYTPGHCDDHISIWLEEEQALFSGDNLLGHGSSVFKDYSIYMRSLMRMRDLPNLSIVYPGHGLVIANGVVGFNQNIEHRYRRELELYEELKRSEALTDEELVSRIYIDIVGRPKKVKIGALANTQHYLAKLEEDGKVVYNNGKWRARI